MIPDILPWAGEEPEDDTPLFPEEESLPADTVAAWTLAALALTALAAVALV